MCQTNEGDKGRPRLGQPRPDMVERKIQAIAKILAAPFTNPDIDFYGIVIRISPTDHKQHISPIGQTKDKRVVIFIGPNYQEAVTRSQSIGYIYHQGRLDGLGISFPGSQDKVYPVSETRVTLEDRQLFLQPISGGSM